MSFDPYNIYYLPILASPEHLQLWDNKATIDTFIKNCQLNFDERSFAMLSKSNNQFVCDFISTAARSDSEIVRNFGKKIKGYAEE
jgi:hypothetical protein